MSNGLADASFFPTAKELSTGLRWVKDHPVLAAAAATAVSVITFLNAAETLAHSRSSASLLDDGDDDERTAAASAAATAAATAAVSHKHELVARRRKIESESSACALPPPPRASAAARVVNASAATTVAGSGSDGKLSAAVSWCDEHGGSLTQVFEELHVTADDASGDHDNGDNDGGECTAAPTGAGHTDDAAWQARTSSCSEEARVDAAAIRKSATQQSIREAMRDDVGSPMLCSPGEIDLQTESPQWGWYVAITPPQDHMHASVPRAVLAPAHRSAGYRASPAPLAPSSTLRRSTSGRIP